MITKKKVLKRLVYVFLVAPNKGILILDIKMDPYNTRKN